MTSLDVRSVPERFAFLARRAAAAGTAKTDAMRALILAADPTRPEVCDVREGQTVTDRYDLPAACEARMAALVKAWGLKRSQVACALIDAAERGSVDKG